jgi:hypothetical protein
MLIGGTVSQVLLSWWSTKPAAAPIDRKDPGEPVSADSDDHEYDESAPGFQRTPLRWRRLLDGPDPRKLAWSSQDANAVFLHRPERSELVVGNAGLGVVALGRVTEPAYKLEIELHPQQGDGQFGVFFGYHAQESNPAQVRYQLITFERTANGGPLLCRQLCEQRIAGPEEIGPPSAKQLSHASVRLDDSAAKLLELEVSGESLKVRWAGQNIRELSDDAFQAATPADQVGQFGVYLFNANGLVREARVMPLKVP